MFSLSARELGKVKMEGFCPRCQWLVYRNYLPLYHPFRSPMPGVVTILDSYVKSVVNCHLESGMGLPHWLRRGLGEGGSGIKGYIPPQKWTCRVGKYDLVGEPDALWVLPDDSVVIADYKTATLNEKQEKLLPLYETQLKAYAYLASKNGHRIGGLALVYLEPQTYQEDPSSALEANQFRFALHFRCSVKRIDDWDEREVEELVKTMGDLVSSPQPPAGRSGCEGCAAFDKWLTRLKRWF